MISVSQIKAARGLIDWSQTRLAEACHLTQRTLTGIETGKTRPTTETLLKIQMVLEENGVEFIEGGVRQKKQHLEIIRGEDFALKLMDKLYKILEETGAKEVLLNGINQKHLPDNVRVKVNEYRQKILRMGVRERFLVPETMSPKYITAKQEDYRRLPDQYFLDTTPTFILDDYYVIMFFDLHEIWFIKNKSLALFQRRLFELLWKTGKPFPSDPL
ncbi:MAG: helix-turn-helix domain-containing protein [Rhodospirillales bacterium]|nr:helix-turn-helix domain-containing protein [Rhodospirillales bacterium]MCB9964620.1 helix-turn-helix domain-containing protein [Rhodospirillales bacterium]MCB9979910.1 helix-turn-helix domain-containing protein [Rhodospirillales bacterium]